MANSDNKAFDMMTAVADKTEVDLFPVESEKGTESIHTALAVTGMIPGIGNVADIMDAALYGLEGDKYGFGLSLMSAMPMFGIVSGGMKIIKGGKKAGEIAKIQKQQVTMVEGAQSVVKAYGKDPSDAKLVSDVYDTLAGAAEGLVEHHRKFDNLIKKGVEFDDAMSVMSYLGSLSPKAIKATKDLEKMGYSEIEIWGKEAVDEMAQFVKKGKELYKRGEMHQGIKKGGYNIYDRMMEGKETFAEGDRKLLEALGVK
mgnify:CR=1 FL=1